MKRLWWLPISGLLAASVSQAQGRSLVGAAFGTTSYGPLSGAGPAVVGMRERAIGRPMSLRGEVRLHRFGLNGSPRSCALVERIYCSGRADRLTALSAGVALVIDGAPPLANAFYAVPIQFGVSHLRASSSEWQAPTLLCVENDQLISCPDNPPFAQRDRRWTVTGATIATGVGLRAQARSLSARLEVRAVSTPGLTRGLGMDVALLLGRSAGV
jgi:hypothetical protein